MNITKNIWDEYRAEGLPGVYRTNMKATFNWITFFPENGKSEFVGTVPGGNYGGPSIAPCGNPDARAAIERKIRAHAEQNI